VISSDTETTRERVVKIIASGGVIGFRTDTFYGLGADPFNAKAVRRISELKGRDGKPILLLISDHTYVARFVTHQSNIFTLAADSFWPGPLTLVAKANPSLPEELTAGTATIGLRLPDDESVRTMVRLCGGALTATSANLTGEPPATSAEQVERYFSSRLDLIVDAGESPAKQPSTVLDVTSAVPRVVREGAVSREALKRVLGVVS